MTFKYEVPGDIHFGADSAKKLGKIVSDTGAKKAIFISDKGVKEAGIVDSMIDDLRSHKVDIVEFDGVLPDPPDTLVEQASQIARKEQIDIVVACGGGSSIDTAKAINILLTNPSPIGSFEGIDKVSLPGKPLIAIPTTSGTASEVTSFSVVTDTEHKRKIIIGGKHVGPSIALIDPLLTLGLPSKLTAATGMDALTHAIEAYVSNGASVLTDVQALKAISLIYHNLPTATHNGDSIEARTGMMLGSMMAGLAFNSTGLGLVHAIAHPLSAHCHLPHGLANAIVLPYVMQFNLMAVPTRYKEIAVAMGLDVSNMSEFSAAESAVDCIARLNLGLDVPTLRQCSIVPDLFDRLADDALLEIAINTNPRKVSKEHILMILEEAFTGVCLQR